jgi:hypothetical protein
MVDHRLTTPRTLSVHAGSQASPTLGVGFSATQPLLGHVFRARAEVWAGTHPSPLERDARLGACLPAMSSLQALSACWS